MDKSSTNGKWEDTRRVLSQEDQEKVLVIQEIESKAEIVIDPKPEHVSGSIGGNGLSMNSSSFNEEIKPDERIPKADSQELEEKIVIFDTVESRFAQQPEQLIKVMEVEETSTVNPEGIGDEKTASDSNRETEDKVLQGSGDVMNYVESKEKEEAFSEQKAKELSGSANLVLKGKVDERPFQEPEINKANQDSSNASGSIEESSAGLVKAAAVEVPSNAPEPNLTTSRVEEVEESLQKPEKTEAADNSSVREDENKPKPEISAVDENPSIISLTRRNSQPTSWRSCCGLLNVLHRSDR